MSAKKLLLSLFMLTLSNLTFSQVPIHGEMVLGDTTQKHILYTKNGDRLVGHITAFDGTKLEFEMLGNPLSFSLSELEKIVVDSPGNTESSPSSFAGRTKMRYRIVTTDGETVDGELIGYAYGNLSVLDKKGNQVKFGIYSIKNFWALDDSSPRDSLPDVVHVITQKNGHQLKGFVKNYEDKKWELVDLEGNTVFISKKLVESIALETKDGEKITYRTLAPVKTKSDAYPIMTRNFVAPTGFMLKKGEGEYRNTEVIFNNVDYGLSDFINIGGGLATVFTENALSGKIKLGASLTPKVHVAAGGQLYFLFSTYDDPSRMSTFYGAITFGNTRSHFTVSASRINDMYDDPYSTITMALSTKISQRHRLFVEYNRVNDIDYGDSFILLNMGGSWVKNSNRLDFGFTVAGEEDFYVPFPIVAYSYYF